MTSTYGTDANQQYQNGSPSKVKLVIHHQFPGIELISPEYYEEGATCYLSPDWRVTVGSTTKAGFDIDSKNESIGTLLYKIQRKNTNQSGGKETWIQLIINWKVSNSKEFCVISRLIKCTKSCV
jgi:hypothetical protein